MNSRALRLLLILTASLLYWLVVSLWNDMNEPWDAPAYWTLAYPLSILFAAGAGLVVRRHGWAVGMMTSFAQLPVMAAQESTPTNWLLALVFLLPLSIPHGVASALAGRYQQRRR